jgi:hypothetical protein
MVNSMKILNKIIIDILLEGPEFLIQHFDSFEHHVDEFISRAWRLPRQGVNYLNALNRLKAEIQSRVSFINTIANDLYLKQLQVQKLIDEGLDLKEAMITNVMSLAAFFHEEIMVDRHTTTCEIELAKLDERKSEIRGYIQGRNKTIGSLNYGIFGVMFVMVLVFISNHI